jgi:hypothetical protein
MTIDHAIAFGVYAEPTNDLTLPFAFVRRGDEIEHIAPVEPSVPEEDDYTANFIINRL